MIPVLKIFLASRFQLSLSPIALRPNIMSVTHSRLQTPKETKSTSSITEHQNHRSFNCLSFLSFPYTYILSPFRPPYEIASCFSNDSREKRICSLKSIWHDKYLLCVLGDMVSLSIEFVIFFFWSLTSYPSVDSILCMPCNVVKA